MQVLRDRQDAIDYFLRLPDAVKVLRNLVGFNAPTCRRKHVICSLRLAEAPFSLWRPYSLLKCLNVS